MLPFGSMLTQLPLIIIGVLYVLYLGVWTVNRSKEVADNDSLFAEQNSHEQYFAPEDNAVPDLYTLLNIISDQDALPQADNNEIHPVFDPGSCEIIFPGNDFPVNDYWFFKAFSRPPPVMS